MSSRCVGRRPPITEAEANASVVRSQRFGAPSTNPESTESIGNGKNNEPINA